MLNSNSRALPPNAPAASTLGDDELHRRICAVHAEQGAAELYRSLRPIGGLLWGELSRGQQDYFRTKFAEAQQATDYSRGVRVS